MTQTNSIPSLKERQEAFKHLEEQSIDMEFEVLGIPKAKRTRIVTLKIISRKKAEFRR